jgi:hypothetical protein
MIKQFNSGIYDAVYNEAGSPKWYIRVNMHVLGIIEVDGLLIQYTNLKVSLSVSDMLEICLLMEKIKRQFQKL